MENPSNVGVDNGAKPKKKRLSKKQLNHRIRIELMKTCMIYGKSFVASQAYFKANDQTLSESNFTDLRKEIQSAEYAKDWFSKESLYVIEQDHKLSVERIRVMEDRLLEEYDQVSATNFYKYLNPGTPQQEIIKNKQHDANLLLRIIAEFRALQETKTKMFGATPMVQEMMEVQRRREEEENNPTPLSTPITNIVK